MHSDTLKLDGYKALTLQIVTDVCTRELLNKLGIGSGVTYGSITRDRLRDKRLAQAVVVAHHLALHATVLIAKRYLEVENLLAIADEAEGTWLDDTCMDRAHIYLVKLLTLNGIEGVALHCRLLIAAVEREAQGLEPWVAIEGHGIELENLALKGVELLVYGSERCEALGVVVGHERGDEHLTRLVVEQNHVELKTRLVLRCKVVCNMVASVGHTLLKVVI